MATEKFFGPGQQGRLDALQISLSHPDAMTAMLSGHSEINAHFSSAPYYDAELKIPGAHILYQRPKMMTLPLFWAVGMRAGLAGGGARNKENTGGRWYY